MRRALHIFKKDVRGLTYEFTVVLALVAMFAIAESQSHIISPGQEPVNLLTGILKLLLPLSWWFLTARVIQAEAIPGDRQFWVTRPYFWTSLLAAKIAFLVAFICIPMAISDAIILYVQGFPVVSNAAGILWEMASRLDIVLIAVVLASFTWGLGSFVIAALVMWILFLLTAQFRAGWLFGHGAISPWSEFDWVLAVTATAAVPAAILMQYARQRRVALALAIGALLIPLSSSYSLRSPGIAPERGKTAEPDLILRIDPSPKRVFVSRSTYKPDQVPVALPIEISGIPEGLQARANQIIVRGFGQPGMVEATLTPDRSSPDPQLFWLEIKVPRNFYQRANGFRVGVDMFATITLYRNFAETAIGHGKFAVPGIGYCQVSLISHQLNCISALRNPPAHITLNDDAGYYLSTTEFPGSPFPAELGISPLVGSNVSLDPKASELITGEPAFRISRSFDLVPIKLEDYVELRAK